MPDLLADFRKGPMEGVDEIVFAARALGTDPHWYANFGSTLSIAGWTTLGRGGRLCRLDLRSDAEWPSMKASAEALQRRCGGCHGDDKPLPLSPSHIVGPGGWGSAFKGNPPWTDLTPTDIRRRWSRRRGGGQDARHHSQQDAGVTFQSPQIHECTPREESA